MSQLNEMNLPRYPLLSDKESKTLLIKAKNGDMLAREEMVNCNLRLVYNLVQRFFMRGYEPDELFQIGVIGLMKAIDKFDTSFNVKFSTYAVPMIIGEIRRFLRDDSPIKISRSIKEMAVIVSRVKEELESELNREVSASEIALKANIALEDVLEAMEASNGLISLNVTCFKDDEEELGNTIADIKADKWFENLAIKDFLEQLPKRESEIMYLRFFMDKTQMEVAKILNISQVQVSRLERGAIKKIREMMNEE